MRTACMFLVLVGCGTSREAATVELPVTTAASALPPVATDLGYEVTVTDLRIAISALQFTIEGEMHAGTAANDIAQRSGATSIIALPHPGHSAGGEVTGELPGDFILRWNGRPQPALGTATLVAGDYHGANFALRAATGADGLDAADPLLGHTFHLEGTVGKDGTTRPFVAVLDVEPDTTVIGAVFEDEITETSTETLAVEFLAADPFEGDTPFDTIDFFTLPETAGRIEILPGSTTHNILRRAIQTHDQYAVVAQ
ncbi:MAG TPA: hypothetical protein VM513_16305 [Kofleriaceae bacterium]|jgi:hypothetical protein|nr:hypothetical protein [Kofleriaceae bacterium]